MNHNSLNKLTTSLNKLTTVASCVYAMTMGASAAQAQVLSINELYLQSGSIDMGFYGFYPLETVNSRYNLVSGYFGAGVSQAPSVGQSSYIDPTAIATGLFGSFQTNIYTAASNLGDGYFNLVGTLVGGPVPSGTLDTVAGTLAVNVSSFFTTINGLDYTSAGSLNNGIANGTWNPVTGTYTMSIVSVDVGGFTSGARRTWTFSGIAIPVPEASTYGMFLAGLGCVVLMARRRRFL